MYNPAIPIIDNINKTINGFLPPVVSTQAENGILNKDPDKDGADINNANKIGLRSTNTCLNIATVGP